MNKENIREALRIQQAADRIGVHYTAIQKAIERGEIEAVRADGKVYVLADSLENYKPRPYGEKRREEGDENAKDAVGL